jgi:hypothetical protein
LRAGYDTYYQGDALVLSTFPADFRTFVRQRVRWTRNTYRSDLRAIWEGWVWNHGFLAFMLVDMLFAPYAQLIGLGYFAFALATGRLIVAGALAAWWLSSRSLKVFPHLRRNPADLLIVPHFVALTFLMAGLKVYALVTLHHHKWLTRQVEVVDGEVVREAAARRDQTPVVMRLAGIAIAAAFFLVVQAAFTALGYI